MEASNPFSGSICFVTNHIYTHVRCGLVDKMISEFSEVHGLRRNPYILLHVFTLSYQWSKLQLVLPSYQLYYRCLVRLDG